jgi:hypothetical protein
MPLQMLFWGIYIFALLFSFWVYYEPAPSPWFRRASGVWILWLLVGILGYRVFGSAIR